MFTPWRITALLVVTGVAFFIGRCIGDSDPRPPRPPTWILHLKPEAIGHDAYDDILAVLPPSERVVLVAPDAATLEASRIRWLKRASVELVVTGHLTPWARDRYVFFSHAGERICVARPVTSLHPVDRGDGEVPDLLVKAGVPVRVARSDVTPIGGDTILTPKHAVVGTYSIEQAKQLTGQTQEQVVAALEDLFQRPVLVVPTHAFGIDRLHVDLVAAHVRGKRFVVGDPRLGMGVFDGSQWTHAELGRYERVRNEGLVAGADAVARALTEGGFEVERVPMLVSEPGPGTRPPVVLSWTNAVKRDDAVLLPSYGVPALDGAAARTWRALGYDIVPIRCASSITYGGAVRCLLNRIAR